MNKQQKAKLEYSTGRLEYLKKQYDQSGEHEIYAGWRAYLASQIKSVNTVIDKMNKLAERNS